MPDRCVTILKIDFPWAGGHSELSGELSFGVYVALGVVRGRARAAGGDPLAGRDPDAADEAGVEAAEKIAAAQEGAERGKATVDV